MAALRTKFVLPRQSPRISSHGRLRGGTRIHQPLCHHPLVNVAFRAWKLPSPFMRRSGSLSQDVSHVAIKPFHPRDCAWLCLLGAAVASVWRGVWYTADVLLFPNSELKSCVTSGMIGISSFAGFYLIVPRLPITLINVEAFRLAAWSIASVGIVCTWRCVWLTWDILADALNGLTSSNTRIELLEGLADTRRGAVVDAPVSGELDWSRLLSAVASFSFGVAVLRRHGHLASVLAPPAQICILKDGSALSARAFREASMRISH